MHGAVRFGSYELRALLGTGGMARVYRAVRVGPLGFEKEVAVKVLDPHATTTADQITSLTDEARLGGLLRHPNIVATDELGQVGPNYYIAMELVDGWALDRLLDEHRRRRAPIPRSVLLGVMIGICDALAYAHALTDRAGEPLGLVHRDMKPGNVMISTAGEVKIMDFGIAKASTNLYATAAQTTRGTPLFMSPEQVMGKPIDRRSDLFALGSLLCELVTLRPAFAGEEIIAILRAVIDVDIDEARERVARIFPEVLPIFLRCMEADPADRYPDASALRVELAALLARVPESVSLRRWAEQFVPLLPATRTGELGAILPVGAGAPNVDRAAETADLSVPTPSGASSFEMPLGPGAGPPRGRPTPSGIPRPATAEVSAPNIAALERAAPAQIAAPMPPLPSRVAAPMPPLPLRRSTPAAPRPGPPTARPSPRAPAPPSRGSRQVWQRRAARNAIGTRLLVLAGIALALVYGLSLLEGPIGDQAGAIWGAIVRAVRSVTG